MFPCAHVATAVVPRKTYLPSCGMSASHDMPLRPHLRDDEVRFVCPATGGLVVKLPLVGLGL